jgi:hypothetical protein
MIHLRVATLDRILGRVDPPRVGGLPAAEGTAIMFTALRWISHRAPWAVAASLAVAACTDVPSATDLHPEGPPMIEQVRMREVYSVGNISGLQRVVFSFGSHADAMEAEVHPVTTAQATGNKLRIIVDELLRGNNLEEIACRAVIDEDIYSRVPVGATPDDIASCSVAKDLLPARCPASGKHSVCICARDGGCVLDDGITLAPKGTPIGVLDRDLDGAADNHRFIKGAVGIRCGDIDVGIDLNQSYWNPSGDQQKPAQGGFDVLGPAIVLVPGPSVPPDDVSLPTSSECQVVFSPDVVDKDGIQVCAPPGGDVTASCTPGDTSAFKFSVEPMTFQLGAGIIPAAQPRTADILIRSNVAIDAVSVGGITVTEDPATNYTDFTAVLSPSNQVTIHWTAVGGLAAATHYTITVPTTVTDKYHKAPPQPFTVAFTTAM